MIISRLGATQTDKDNNFWANAYGMSEETFIFGVTIGVFVFFVGLRGATAESRMLMSGCVLAAARFAVAALLLSVV